MPSVSVIVPVRNESRSIEHTLRALLTQDFPRDQYEVIVADGASTDQTVPIVRRLQTEFPNLKLVYDPGQFSSAGRNTALRHAAGVGAGIRHQIWQQAVQGTRPAQPWVAFHTRHLTEPGKYSYEQAVADFWAQARISAMRAHNAANAGVPLAIDELEMLQAGVTAYQHYSAMTAICGDALLTAERGQLAPASDAFADRMTYLEQAIRYLDGIENTGQRLVAVSL